LLDNLRAGKVTRPEMRLRKPTPSPIVSRGPSRLRQNSGGSASVTIPLTVTVSLGNLSGSTAVPQRYRPPPVTLADDSGGMVDGDEAVAEDYRDRAGYQSDFLGKDKMTVDLPSVERDADDVLDFQFNGKADTELRYEHYSVMMSRSRRMCFVSAVNIDGNLSKKSARVGWKWDPRIPKAQQIMNECYGSPPKFSRGHMTRREDPGWGKEAKTAKRGNEDSMHVTNTTPQMQAFNAPIWLALEDYALGHAKEDEMKISVFTGPYFDDQDPEMYGVRIPIAFWKIIAFIHDETGRLCATGYEMNQETTLQPEEEFVFGAFTSPQLKVATQVSIRSIEVRSGISFGRLASVDPLAGSDEGLAGAEPRPPLEALEQIRFVR
jgi:endonuclease G, mitochondrial